MDFGIYQELHTRFRFFLETFLSRKNVIKAQISQSKIGEIVLLESQ